MIGTLVAFSYVLTSLWKWDENKDRYGGGRIAITFVCLWASLALIEGLITTLYWYLK